MSHERFTEKVNDYFDDCLSEADRLDVESHIESCPSCHELLEDLRALRRDTRRLSRPQPPEHVWTAISHAIARSDKRGAWHGALAYLAVAATLVLGVALWLGLRGGGRPESDDPEALVSLVTEELQAAESHYGNAIEGLERIMAQNEGVLPAELDSVLSENLDLIERAIQDSRAAIRSEPGSRAARESLLSALRRKVNLLQNTILLINEIRKGEGENALDRIDELRESSDPI